MTMIDTSPRPIWGLSGFIIGTIAIALAGIVMTGTFDPPSQPVGITIGEIAADIKNAAKAAITGEANAAPTPAPEPVTTPLRDIATFAIPVLAALAAICGAVGLFKHETRTLPLLAISAGAAAITLQFAIWLALMICGVILLGSILSNLDSILS